MELGQLIRAVVPAEVRPYRVLSRLAWRGTGGSVQRGPFAGMKYVSESANSALVPKLLGVYELELFSAIEAMIDNCPSCLVDIGSAEGYYAVGFALRCPSMKVIAFDRDPNAQKLTALMSTINGVNDRVEVRAECTVPDLASILEQGPALVVCDAEGFEMVVLDPSRVPGLISSTVLVEVHDHLVPDVGATLIRRFERTHQILRINAIPRTARDCPRFHRLLSLVPDDTVLSLIVERPAQSRMYWLLMAPNPVRSVSPQLK